eukprot:gnl/TRDRNA2_/TRDRNA2_152525_c0_seq1.p1 gnl/TRDRNA2_/TRDRNA2_152525_c0~~gnl/TRDRNA2_/TRDRNA2_152525_c0_seq1.p1  ORF type:complete len:345 (-),score=85.19 gnl/TRDRNA2_/TRDRNA2_152525_c0_seq1:114-1097(-)
MTRIIHGIDEQTFVIGWIKRHPVMGHVEGEQYDVVICHKSDVRHTLLEALTALSGPGIETRLEAVKDVLMTQMLKKRTSSNIICMTNVYKQIMSLVAQQVQKETMHLFLLTETDIIQLDIEWKNWLAPFTDTPELSDGEAPNFEDDDDGPIDANVKARMKARQKRLYQTNTQQWFTGKDDLEKKYKIRNTRWALPDAPDLEKVLREREDARAIKSEDVAKMGASIDPNKSGEETESKPVSMQKAMRRAKSIIAKVGQKTPLSKLEQVEFVQGDVPVLKLQFANNEMLQLRFLDDVARERWRRGLAYVLNKSDTAAQWRRDWDSFDIK